MRVLLVVVVVLILPPYLPSVVACTHREIRINPAVTTNEHCLPPTGVAVLSSATPNPIYRATQQYGRPPAHDSSAINVRMVTVYSLATSWTATSSARISIFVQINLPCLCVGETPQSVYYVQTSGGNSSNAGSFPYSHMKRQRAWHGASNNIQ